MREREASYRKKAAELFIMLSGGLDDGEAREILEVTERQYAHLKKLMFRYEGERISKSTTEQVYLQYVINQMSCIAEIDDSIREWEKNRNSGAIVGAIRTRSDIYDKVIKLGQEFGILEKRPEEKRIIAGVVVAQLSDEQLRQAITSELSSLNKLVESYGDQNILDVDPGELHYALPEPASAGKRNRAKANRIHGGRRVVKEKALK